jgi:hypothetical protein
MSPSPNIEWDDPEGVLRTPAETPRKAPTPVEAFAPFQTPFEQLRARAVERPDIAKPGEKPFTFAGRVVKPGETPEEVLKRQPLAELEAGGRALPGGVGELALGLGLSKAAVAGAAAPKQSAAAIGQFVRNVPGRWRDFWQNIGENILSKTPSVFRAGRGIEYPFREAKFQMEADAANRLEQAVALGRNLKKDLSLGERLRADQLLRGATSREERIVMGEARQRVKFTPDAKAYQADLDKAADQILAEKIANKTATKEQIILAGVRPIRRAIDEIQDELIKLGRLSPETVERFQENFGPYLARLYTAKEFAPQNPVFSVRGRPLRAGTQRLMTRGERVEVEIPSFEEEMNRVARLIGPEAEFRREFRKRAGELAKRRETTRTTGERTETLGERRQTEQKFEQTGGPGTFTQVPLSGVSRKLEEMVEGALTARGMTLPEAQAAIGRVKAAAVKTAQAGPEVEITAGGATKETTKETITRETRTTRETVKQVIENLGINKGQQAALHAYYDAITRAGAKAKSVKVGDRTFKISPIMDPESATERVQSLDPLLRAGFRVEKRAGNKVTLFRDIPEDIRVAPSGAQVVRGGRPISEQEYERLARLGTPNLHQDYRGNFYLGGKVELGMGEIRADPGYVAGKGIAQAGREVAITRFFKTVADNPEWASNTAKADWYQMPKDPKRLGDLSGKWLRPDIAAEINDAVRQKADWQKMLAKTTALWKMAKVINPATMARNFYSSSWLADWGGLSPYRPSGIKSYHMTIQGFRGVNPAAVQYLDEARKAGIFNAGYNHAELNALASGYLGSKEANPVLRILDGIGNITQKTGLPTAYGSIDNFYKAALFTHGRREGMNIAEAARYARKYGIDYSDVSPFVKVMRDIPLGAPFLTFASKAIPLAIETSVKHPIRFWKYPAIIYGATELSLRSFRDEREQVEKVGELAHMRSPRFVTLPGKTPEGRNQFLDLGYILPFGDLLETFDKLRGGTGDANISFEPLGGPFQPIMEISFNKSRFTGRTIWNERIDTYPEVAAKISDHFFKSILPAWAPPVPYTGFRGGYTTEAFRKAIPDPLAKQAPGEAPMPLADFYGRTRSLGAVIASKIFGIDIKQVSLNDVRMAGALEIDRIKDDLARESARIVMSHITKPQKEAELLKIGEKYKALEDEVRKRLGMPPKGQQGAQQQRAVGGGAGGWTDPQGLLK